MIGGYSEKITIVGVGRLGLCVALCLERAGYDVVGVDLSDKYVAALNEKTFRCQEPRVNEMLMESKNFTATTDLKKGADHSDVLYIMVDTPSTGQGDNKHYDVSKLGRVLSALNSMHLTGKHIIIGCTVLPGYNRNIGKFLLRDCTESTLSYNPEFICQGAIVDGFLNPDMVLIGEGSKEAGDVIESIYRNICESKPTIARMTPASAEITKLALNCFVTTKIAYANMVADVAEATPGANAQDILAAVGADSRVGLKYMRPGYGFGGPCFPRDNRAFGGYATSVGVTPFISQATDASNKHHAELQIQRLLATGDEEFTIKDVGYKKNCPVPIIEESQKLIVAAGVAKTGKRVIIEDRDFIVDLVMREYGSLFEYRVVKEIPNGHIIHAQNGTGTRA